MVNSTGMKPSAREREKYLAKIDEWRSLGFDVTGLADLLDSDFAQFKRRRLEMLRGQIGESPIPKRPPVIEEEETEDIEIEEPEEEQVEEEEEDEIEEAEEEEESTILVGAPLAKARPSEPKGPDEKIMLVGKPLPVEPPPPDDEETILVGDTDEEIEPVKKEKKIVSKEVKAASAARVREISEEKEEVRKEEEKEEEEEEVGEIPSGIIGMDAPIEKTKKEKKEKKAAAVKPSRAAKRRSNMVAAVGVAGILIMAVLLYMMYDQTLDNGGNGNGGIDSEVEAVIDAFKTTATAGETVHFNAQQSKGEISSYRWIFDTDFIITSGSLTDDFVAGYFTQTSVDKKQYTVSVTVENSEGLADTTSITVTINPFEAAVTEELLDDSATYRVEGNITVTNPDNIASFTYSTGEPAIGDLTINVEKIVMDFKTLDEDPMTSVISEFPTSKKDGFMRLHSVYSREIRQNLDLIGSMEVTAESVIDNYDQTLEITGSMNSIETSYTDYTTDHTIQIYTTNDLSLFTEIEEPLPIPVEIQSTDELTSFPDLRMEPTRLRLADLSDEPIGLGDSDIVKYDAVAYSWYAVSIEQILGNPAVKVEFNLDTQTRKDNNIEEFSMYLWLGDNKPVALKSDLYIKMISDGNIIEVKYANRLVEYISGNEAISSKVCNLPFNQTHHFATRYSDIDSALKDDFSDNWNYLPTLKNSNLTNSFESFSPDTAMNSYVLPLQGVTNYLNSYTGAYVTTAYCNRTNTELVWNVTFGKEGSTDGYNVLVGETAGVRHEMPAEILEPMNSTDDFWPVLTFAGSEHIFKALNDPKINDNVFFNNNINFDTVSYGVTASLSYPTVDFTSVTNFQSQKYAYFAIAKDNSFATALDAETGQLLFVLEHDYTGFDLPI